MKYGCIMRPVEVTASNNKIQLIRTEGAAPPYTVDATLSLTGSSLGSAATFVPSGDADTYDLLKNIEDALDAGEVLIGQAGTYSADWETDSITGTTSRITITNDQGNAFYIDFADTTNTTMPAHWIGAAEIHRGAHAIANIGAASSHTFQYHSSLLWHPQQPFLEDRPQPAGTSVSFQTTTISGLITTSTLAGRRQAHTHRWDLLQSVDHSGERGGRVELAVETLDPMYIFGRDGLRYTTGEYRFNRSLAAMWEYLRTGGWFILIDDATDAASPAVLDDASFGNFCRLTEEHTGRGLRDLERLFRLQTRPPQPEYYSVSFAATAIDYDDLGAGGA